MGIVRESRDSYLRARGTSSLLYRSAFIRLRRGLLTLTGRTISISRALAVSTKKLRSCEGTELVCKLIIVSFTDPG